MARHRHLVCLLALTLLLAEKYTEPAVAGQSKTVTQFNRLVLKRHYEKSAAVLKEPAKAGDAESQYRLASLYRIGLGVTRDDQRARTLLRRASGSGHLKAQRLLARLEAFMHRKTDPVRRPVKSDSSIFVPPVAAHDKDAAGNSWMTSAAARGQVHALAIFADQAIQLSSALLSASAAGQADAAVLLVRLGAPVNAKDPEGRTALMLSAASSSPVLTENLLSFGADMTLRDAEGRTALHYALQRCNLEAAGALIRTVSSPGTLSAGPPMLHLALANCRNAGLIGALLPNLDIDLTDESGRTGLWLAAFNGDTAAVRLLLSRHANVMHMDALGMTPLHMASSRCEPDIVNLLLQAGAAANATSRDGNTPLMLAAASDCTEGLALLIAAHAATDAVNQQGDAALLIAVRTGSLDAVKLLMAAGASPAARNARRETPYVIATRLGRTDIVALLPEP